MTSTEPKPWQELRDAKKAEQLSRIPKEWILDQNLLPTEAKGDLRGYAATSGILSARELNITEHDATELLEHIAKGDYSAEEVAVAYCKRAAIAQQLCNCLTEIAFTEAIEQSKRLDEHFQATNGKTIGPLHGLPMTFKECFHLKGFDASDGYISRVFDPSTYDSYMIKLMKQAGALIISKTNVPQTMLVGEADNNVFGRTKNPVVAHLTCCGSSGGEASVIAFHGSAIGIGTDVAGSIRAPAAVCGIYGYKPSFGILPMMGFAASNWQGMNTGIPAVLGPMARSARDLTLLTKVTREMHPEKEDPAIIRNVFEQPILDRKPVIGVIGKSGLTPHPPIRRAIQESADKLRAAGYDVKELDPPDFAHLRNIAQELFTLDGLSYPRIELAKAGEPVIPSVEKIGFWKLHRKTMEEAWALNASKLAFQKQMLDVWEAANVDIVLCPPVPHPALLPDDWENEIYTVVWSAVDYPAIVVPVSVVDPEKDPEDNIEPLSATDERMYAKYDSELMAGAPVSIQLVGRRLEDAQLLRDVELIDKVLQKNE